jgi:hypothetical protein
MLAKFEIGTLAAESCDAYAGLAERWRGAS